ncbi:MAG: TonB-dependent receptor [Burkholderiales bacterium]|nr:TonB-dependent receptor [Burkholderiales bacterium]
MKIKRIVQAISLVLISGPVLAQAPATPAKPPAKPEKIEVTGSSIKRVQDEGALPLQIITKDEIDKAGIVSAEELVAIISANGAGRDNMSSNVGITANFADRNNFGAASANLRGLGSASTLVLLNGRRMSSSGIRGVAVDLNSIPLAAIQRVEVLKDGASAIYGTDAIGGVINFILKKDFNGIELTGFTNVTHDGGGDINRFSLTAGMGDLAKDRYNVMVSATFDKQETLRGRDRDFVNGNQPNRGLTPDTTGTPFATQTGGPGTAMGASFVGSSNINGIFQLPGATQTYNRANLLSFTGNCDSVPGMTQYRGDILGPSFYASSRGCAYDYGREQILLQPFERVNYVARATFELSANHTAFVEAVGSNTKSERTFEQRQITTSIAAGNAYPVNGPFYQDLSQFIPTFDRTRPIAYRWRCIACGNRVIETESESFKFLVGMEGTLGSWDYKVGLAKAGSKSESLLKAGYYRTVDFNAALATGLINPWLLPGQSQTDAAMALLQSTSAAGSKLQGGEFKLTQFDASLSGEVMQGPAGPIAAAVGFDVRKEEYFLNNNATATAIADAPFPTDIFVNKRDRDIRAVFAEVAVPLMKNLEFSAAVRHDDYSDFGTTTNPKVSFKFQPIPELLIRGSYSEGFRAPSFTQLYSPSSESQIPGNIADPVLCPQNPGNPVFCAIRPLGRSGGNPNLQPETSEQRSIGFVVSPTNWLTANMDAYEIRRNDRIYVVTPQLVVANPDTFPNGIVRGPNGRIDEVGGYIQGGLVNADGDITRGIDIGMQVRTKIWDWNFSGSVEGTYVDSFKSRIFKSQAYRELAGQWDVQDLFPRWKHTARATFSRGPWSTTVSQYFTSGYRDEAPAGVANAPDYKSRVEDYITYNVSATYTGFKKLTITGGILNVFNTDPPFTAHNVDFAAGTAWDPRVASPRGRAYTLRLTYKF